MEKIIETPVLIVGAGSAGLTLAGELAQRGVGCVIADSRTGPNVHPRASSLGPRAMEQFRRWGIAEKLMQSGAPSDFPLDVVFTTRLKGYEIHRFAFPCVGELYKAADRQEAIMPELDWSPYFKVQIGQNVIEPILAEFATSHPGTRLHYQWKLESFSRSAEGVESILTEISTNQRIRVRSRYLVGCDGARSAVRRAMGVEYKGRGVLARNKGIYFESEHFDRVYGRRTGRLLWTLAPDIPGVFIAINGRRGWTFNQYFVDDDTVVDASTVWRAMGAEFPLEVISVQSWSGYELVAERYGEDNVFIAGDAAHLFHPTGGFGMNTSIGDAIDLGWKLAAVLQGWGGPGLLATYDTERRPVAISNGREAAGNFDRLAAVMRNVPAAVEAAGLEGERIRKAMGEELNSQIRTWTAGGVHLGYSYEKSPIVIPDGTPAPPADARHYTPNARPGGRAPHIWLEPGRSTLDLIGAGFTLLRIGPQAPAPDSIIRAAKSLGVPLDVANLPEPDFLSRYQAALVLVRPDGHICWRADEFPADPGAILHIVRGDPQSNHASPVSHDDRQPAL
jgi:2-polyprenyl-6-methoxyphenol hydroxylase-like FAD-dependent oxidoreductase